MVLIEGSSSWVNCSHPSNALSSILVTQLGVVTEVKPEQPAKALFQILVTEFGIVTELTFLQPEMKFPGISLTVSPNVTDCKVVKS